MGPRETLSESYQAPIPGATRPVESERLTLVSMSPAFLVSCMLGDRLGAKRLLGAMPDREWLAQVEFMAVRLAQLEFDPTLQPWLLRAILLRPDAAGGSPVMVGHIGFHSRPGPDYLADIAPQGVELGYTIYSPFRRRGYATEACQALMRWAKEQPEPGGQFVLSIRPDNEPSLAIARRFGFQMVTTYQDAEDGLEHVYVLPAEAV
jgi:[ribosomal protein S5]-alanine N-acetyltransferase